jgi:hypothetical protein
MMVLLESILKLSEFNPDVISTIEPFIWIFTANYKERATHKGG